MRSETEIEWTQRCSGRPWSSEFGDAFGGRDRVNPEMHMEAIIERVWRFTGRRWLSEFRDALWGRDRASLEMQSETGIEWTHRCTGRPWLSEFRHALGGRDQVNWDIHSELWSRDFRDALAAGYDRGRLEEYLEVVDLEVVDGRRVSGWDSIHRLVYSKLWECDEVTLPFMLLRRTSWWQSLGREVHRNLKLHSGVNSKSREWRDNRQS